MRRIPNNVWVSLELSQALGNKRRDIFHRYGSERRRPQSPWAACNWRRGGSRPGIAIVDFCGRMIQMPPPPNANGGYTAMNSVVLFVSFHSISARCLSSDVIVEITFVVSSLNAVPRARQMLLSIPFHFHSIPFHSIPLFHSIYSISILFDLPSSFHFTEKIAGVSPARRRVALSRRRKGEADPVAMQDEGFRFDRAAALPHIDRSVPGRSGNGQSAAASETLFVLTEPRLPVPFRQARGEDRDRSAARSSTEARIPR